MKKAFYLLFASTLSFTFLFSQNNSSNIRADWDPQLYQVGKIYPGYIIKLDGDTIQGYVKALSRCSYAGIGNSNQNMCEFFSSQTDKKPIAKYKPKDIRGYKIADKLYESINYSGGMLKAANFNLIVTDGAIRLYEWYATVDGFSTLNQQSGETWQQFDNRRFNSKVIAAKNPEEPIELSMLGLSFAKKMPLLIADNPEMAEKVKNKEKGYKFINMYDVIDEYNQWAKSK